MNQQNHREPQRSYLSARKRLWLLIWSLLRLVIVLPVWLISIVMVILGWALSPWGTSVLLNQAEQRDWVQVQGHEGSLLEHLTLEGVNLDVAGLALSMGELELKWAEDCVLSGRLCIDTFKLIDADLYLPVGNDKAEDEPRSALPENIRLPFPIDVRELMLEDINVRLEDGTRVRWERFTTAISAEENLISIAPTHLERPQVYLPPSPGVLLADTQRSALSSVAIDSAIELQAPLEPVNAVSPAEAISHREPIELPSIKLPIGLELPAFSVNDFVLSGATDYTINSVQLGLTAQGSQVNVSQLDVTSADASVTMRGQVDLQDNYPLNAQLDAQLRLPEIMPALAGEEISLQVDGALNALNVALTAQGPVAASIKASVDALAPTLPFQIRLDSDQLRWPLTSPSTTDNTQSADQPYVLEELAFTAEGDLEDYRLNLQFNAQGPQVPPSQLAVQGEGNLNTFNWAPLTVNVNDSQLSSKGNVAWQDGLGLDAIVELSNVNPNDLVPSVDGQLNGLLDVSVRQQGDRWTMALPVLDITGELQDYPFNLKAALSADSSLNVDLQQLDFAQGENRLNASGQISPDNMNLDATIDMRGLQTLANELKGALSGQIQARGSLKQPQLAANLEGQALQVGENRLNALQLDADISGIEDPKLAVRLAIDDAVAGGQAFESALLSLDGRLSEHTLSVDLAGGAANEQLERVNLTLDGQFDQPGQRYQASLLPFDVVSAFGTIGLDAPLALDYRLDSGEARVSPFCLRRQEGGLVCADNATTVSADNGSTALSLNEVPMQMLAPLLPKGWSLQGDTTADMTASWRQGGAFWEADLGLDSRLEITALNEFGQPVTLPELRLETRISATPQQLDSTARLALADAGDISLDLGIADPLGEARLNGDLKIADIRLNPYREMVVGLDTLEGQLAGNVRIAGSVTQPDLQGSLTLNQLQAAGADLPIVIPDGEVNMDFDGTSGRIEGFVDAQRGRLNIQGDAVWPGNDNWAIGIDLEATQSPLLVSLPQFGRLEAAPDLRIRIAPDRLQVRGDVNVPWARLEAGELPASVIGPSSDEIIITERDDKEAERLAAQRAKNGGPSAVDSLEQGGMVMDVQININLGEDMQLAAYGLNSSLQGTLEVNQDSGGLQLFGDINLVDGRFKSFGQDLVIRRGGILFSGPPGLPSLDFEAIRNPEVTQDDVIVGVRVRGLADSPNLTIFSNPGMNETRALSYLLRGRAPDESGSGFNSAMTTALISMSLGRTGGAVGSIGEAFGIDDLRLDTAGAGDNSQVALSGQLTDDISISYGVGIFTPIAELTLRYTLWRDLYLQAVSGTHQAVDLIYQFSRSGNPSTLDAR